MPTCQVLAGSVAGGVLFVADAAAQRGPMAGVYEMSGDTKGQCGTCAFWGGKRRVSADRKTVFVQSLGWCNNHAGDGTHGYLAQVGGALLTRAPQVVIPGRVTRRQQTRSPTRDCAYIDGLMRLKSSITLSPPERDPMESGPGSGRFNPTR